MFLRTVVVILLIFTFFSCGKTSTKRNASSTVQLLDTVIDYTSVDAYPQFLNCQDLLDKRAQKKCFEETLTKKLSDYLQATEYKVRERVNDSAFVEFMINNNGKAKVISISSSQIVKDNLPLLDSIITAGVNQLPIVEKPATKRGIPIKSQYKLAVIVQTN